MIRDIEEEETVAKARSVLAGVRPATVRPGISRETLVDLCGEVARRIKARLDAADGREGEAAAAPAAGRRPLSRRREV